MSKIELYNADCLEKMKEIPDKSVDLILTDPPYGRLINENWDKNNKVFNLELINEFYRVLKNTGNLYVWCGIGEKSRSMLDFIPILDSKFIFKDLITWKKNKGIGMRKGWLYTREEILWYVKDNKSFNWNTDFQYSDELRKTSNKTKCIPKSEYKRITNIWDDITNYQEGNIKFKDKLHPCAKPIHALERIIKVSTKERDTVLDCFMGSGSTGVACVNTNRNFIGIELDENYFNIAKKRIEESQQNIFTM